MLIYKLADDQNKPLDMRGEQSKDDVPSTLVYVSIDRPNSLMNQSPITLTWDGRTDSLYAWMASYPKEITTFKKANQGVAYVWIDSTRVRRTKLGMPGPVRSVLLTPGSHVFHVFPAKLPTVVHDGQHFYTSFDQMAPSPLDPKTLTMEYGALNETDVPGLIDLQSSMEWSGLLGRPTFVMTHGEVSIPDYPGDDGWPQAASFEAELLPGAEYLLCVSWTLNGLRSVQQDENELLGVQGGEFKGFLVRVEQAGTEPTYGPPPASSQPGD